MIEIKAVNEENFDTEVKNCSIPTLLDFYTPTCAPCKSVSVILEKYYQTAEGKLKIVKVNAAECTELTKKLGVRTVPTLMLFKGGNVIDTKTKVLLPHELSQWVESCIQEKASEQ